MLDAFEIITTSGVVLWSKFYEKVDPNLINDFLRLAFIDQRFENTQSPTYKRDGKTIKWTTSKDLGLIFVVCTHYLQPDTCM
jgi:signal recognition particle receptor subunit alpha